MLKHSITSAVGLLWFFMLDTALAQNRVLDLSLDQHIEHAVGVGVVDCGTFSIYHRGMAMPPRESSTATTKPESMVESLACARDALKQKKPFRIAQRGYSFDTGDVFTGVIGRSDGTVMWFGYSSMPCGGPGCISSFTTAPCDLSQVVVIHEENGNHSFGRVR